MVRLKPREYQGPLDTPDDYLFAQRMCRLGNALSGDSRQRREEREEENKDRK